MGRPAEENLETYGKEEQPVPAEQVPVAEKKATEEIACKDPAACKCGDTATTQPEEAPKKDE
jgi:hypothetical protein